MQRYSPILSIVLLTVAIFSNCALAAERQNILLIMCDDLNCALGCYDDAMAVSPNIDRLASKGVLFDHAYCQFPLCGPSRNSMLTGLYPDSNGILQNSQIFRQTVPAQPSISQHLRLTSDYWTGRVGKLYHYGVPRSIGTSGSDDPESWEWAVNPAGCDRLIEEPEIFSLTPGQFGGTLSWFASPRHSKEHTDALVADAAINLLKLASSDAERPFFLAVGFYRPHTPYVSPEEFFAKYPTDKIELPSGIQTDREDIPQLALASGHKNQDDMTDDLRRQAIQAYRAAITFVDEQVGRVVSAADELGLADSTTIIFTSDHGYHLGEHGLWQKQSLFEESARVPLIISSPNVRQNEVCHSPVGLIDIAPTVNELCTTANPEVLQGQSLVPMLHDPKELGRGWSLSQVRRGGKNVDRMGYSIRSPDWRYTLWNEGEDGHELYDHRSDAKELTNLANDERYANIVADLRRTLSNAVAEFMPVGGRPVVKPLNDDPNLTESPENKAD